MEGVDLGLVPKILTEDDREGDVGNRRMLGHSLRGHPLTGSGSTLVRSIDLGSVPKILTEDNLEGDVGNR